MAKKEYDWLIGDTPPLIELHSITKHRVYENYLSHYIQVLNSNPMIPEFRLNLIDGFSGGGVYTHPTTKQLYDGSPLRLIKTAEAAEAAVNLNRQNAGMRAGFRLYVNYYFIEQKKSNFDYLNHVLNEQGYTQKYQGRIVTINSSFSSKLDGVIKDIQKRGSSNRCIFILDQYGYSDVPFNDIKRIFNQLPNAEVILTFATDWLIDYMTNDEKYIKGLRKSGINEAIDIDDLLNNKNDSKEWRQLAQTQLHKAIFDLSGARHYTPFFIVSKESKRSFWLVHLSNHPKARDVMTQLHWELKNHFSHYAGPGLRMFGYDPRNDNLITGTQDIFANSEYSFDEEARIKTQEHIIEELPSFINDYEDGVSFGELYRVLSNQTPGTSDHIKEVSEILVSTKELQIISPDGREKRKASTIRDDDIIRIPKQRLITFGKKSDLLKMSKRKKGR